MPEPPADTPTGDGDARDPHVGPPRWVRVSAIVVVVLIVLVVVLLLVGGGGHGPARHAA